MGYNYKGSVTNSYATGNASASSSGRIFTSSYSVAGGLIGKNYRDNIENSHANGDVAAFSNLFNTYSGGLVGHNSGIIENSYATGNSSASAKSCHAYSAGLLGYNYKGSVTNSYATGNASASSSGRIFTSSYSVAGGLIGKNYRDSIENSYATGNSSASTKSCHAYSAGLVGYNRGSIVNSYAIGNAFALSQNKNSFSGGLIVKNNDGNIENSYSNREATITIIGKEIEINMLGISSYLAQLRCPTFAGKNCEEPKTSSDHNWNASPIIKIECIARGGYGEGMDNDGIKDTCIGARDAWYFGTDDELPGICIRNKIHRPIENSTDGFSVDNSRDCSNINLETTSRTNKD